MTQVRKVIAARGMRYDWLADRIQVSPSHLTKMLNGERRVLPDTASRMADVLGLPIEFIQPKQEGE